MVKNKTPIWETNSSPSEFVPSNPAMNAALQNTQVDGFAYNKVSLQDMQQNPVLYDNSASDLDKTCLVNQELQKSIPDVKKAAENFKNVYKSLRSKK